MKSVFAMITENAIAPENPAMPIHHPIDSNAIAANVA
jgi:hypothetical protein